MLHDSVATCDAVPNVSDHRSADGALKNFVAEAVSEAGNRNDECVEGDLLLGQNVFAKARKTKGAHEDKTQTRSRERWHEESEHPAAERGACCGMGRQRRLKAIRQNSSGRGHASHEMH